MLGAVWVVMLTVGTVAAVVLDGPSSVARIVADSTRDAVQLCLGLAGLAGLWSGVSALADESGLTVALARAVKPITRRLFPGLSADSEAHGAIAASVSANLLGLGGAATPLGLRAMEAISRSVLPPPAPGVASDEMCTFVVLIASGLTLVPTSIMAVRSHAGSLAPAIVTGPLLIATTCSTATALALDAAFRRARRATSTRMPLGGTRR
ncbi:MAG: Spore maturation protein A [Firmicutes bacterium ADurb.Bin506]|jgi:spore maturation protein A|nr:MAG: Spore maturation protein A [Firmicutes bacterium ADurb.Bin506]